MEMEMNKEEIIYPTHEEQQEERCLKAAQSPCFPSLAPKSHKKQENLLPPTNPFLPSSSSWEDCFPQPCEEFPPEFPAEISHQKNNPFLPASTAVVDDRYPPHEEVVTMETEENGSFSDLSDKKEEKTESSTDSSPDHDHDHHHHHKKWFSLPKLDPRHRWPQGWC